MEMEKVPQAGFEIKGLWISGIQRKLTLKNLMFPLKLISSLIKAKSIISKFKPDLVIGTGGYASGPLVRMAASAGIPCLLQEQNSFPGITNRWLAGKAEKICVAYEGLERFFPASKIVNTGNPIREDILAVESNQAESLSHFGLESGRTTLLILGGSLGAKRINELIESKLEFFEENKLQLLWQCGKLYYDRYRQHNSNQVKVLDFVNRMDLAYDAAGIIISRAGAGSISELAVVGKPVLFIPSPNVAEDHQTKNASALVDKNAAIMLKENELEDNFEMKFSGLLNSEMEQDNLAKGIQMFAKPKATEHIADEIVKLLKTREQ